MKWNKKLTISVLTFIISFPIMFFGISSAIVFFSYDIAGNIGIVWTGCTAVLFLCEYLFGLMKKRFSANLGAFVATAIMGVGLTVVCIQNARNSRVSFMFPGLDEFKRAFTGAAFMPPIIVSIIVNIGNIIYKVRSGKTDRQSDQQP